MQGCREGGAHELGHMVAQLTLLETVTAKPVLRSAGAAPSAHIYPPPCVVFDWDTVHFYGNELKVETDELPFSSCRYRGASTKKEKSCKVTVSVFCVRLFLL